MLARALATYLERDRGETLLRETNAALERRVAEQTDELRTANHWLASELAERKLAEAALRTTENRFRSAFDHSAIGMALLTPEGRYLRVNPALRALLGYSEEEFLADTYQALTHPDDLAADAEYARQLLAGENVTHQLEKRYRHKSGYWVWTALSAALVRDAAGRPAYFFSQIQDITARKDAEAALYREREFLGAVLENLREGIVACDAAGTLTLFNRASSDLHGLPAAALPANQWAEHYALYQVDGRTPLRAEEIPLFRALRGEVVRDAEIVIAPNSGTPHALRVNGQAIQDVHGHTLGAVVAMHDVTERKRAEEALRHQATHDPLTDLPNRVLFLEHLQEALTPHPRRKGQVAVLFLDLDRFKVVNDSLGHAAGDRLLVAAAARLRGCLRSRDTLARLGADEFTILLRRVRDVAEATAVAERIGTALQTPFIIDGRPIVTTASIGLVLRTPGEFVATDLLRDADVAMYRAKAQGSGRYAVSDASMSATAIARLEVESDLRLALERGELRVYYQPQVALATGRVVAFEALVRWQHPARGLVFPNDFIPLAEETGLILPLGRWVREEACRQARAWREQYPATPPSICVNLSAAEFGYPGLAEGVATLLGRHALAPGSLELEITESVLMADAPTAATTLRALKAQGVRLALDDFGTGYSSLAYLKRFPVDTLKIDRAFVRGLGRNAEDTALVGAIVTLGHALGLAVVAEGAETDAHVARLLDLGCDLGQGYFFARPLLPDEAGALLGYGISETPSPPGTAASG